MWRVPGSDDSTQRATFRALGFPVHVSAGFLLGLLLLFALNASDTRFAIWLVGAMAVLTLVHELGHASAARAFGADATISLNFLVGWAQYTPGRQLTRAERAVITVAGPLAQIAGGGAALVVAGVNPLSSDQILDDVRWIALWWAGPALGLLNLVPALPLDGGHLLGLAADRIAPGRGMRAVLWLSAAVWCGATAYVLVDPTWRGFVLVTAMLAWFSIRELRSGSAPAPGAIDAARRSVDAARQAERTGWATGRPGLFPPGFVASPWLRAAGLAAAGRDSSARQLLVEMLQRDTGTWVPPEGAPVDQLRALALSIPEPAPVEAFHAGWVFQGVLHQVGAFEQSAAYGARLYDRHREARLAHDVARSLARLGQDDLAMEWLTAAHADGGLVSLLDDPDLARLAARADFRALVARHRS
ncbi:MAG: metalloprotease [Acidimicrobiales bacterium]